MRRSEKVNIKGRMEGKNCVGGGWRTEPRNGGEKGRMTGEKLGTWDRPEMRRGEKVGRGVLGVSPN